MARAVCLFTGQWADLPLEKLAAPRPTKWAIDGLELACWGDHFDVQRGLREDDYMQARTTGKLLASHGMTRATRSPATWSARPICDNIDERHKAILSENDLGGRGPGGRAASAPPRR